MRDVLFNGSKEIGFRAGITVRDYVIYGKSVTQNTKNAGIGSTDILEILEQLPPDTRLVRFFEREGYEVYGEGAIKVAAILHSSATIGNLNGLQVLSISAPQLAVVLKELLVEHRIEIWSFNSVRRNWRMSSRASPGNLDQIETYLGEDVPVSPVIAAIATRQVEGNCRVGLATVDVGRMKIGWTSFVDAELFNNLEAALLQVDARECIYPKGLEIESLFATGETIGTAVAPSEFINETLISDLKRLIVRDIVVTDDIPVESQMAISGVIKYLSLLTVDENLGMFRVERLNLSQYMRLDETAFKALGIFSNTKNSSLFGILDHCKTKQGTRMLSQWLRQPLLNIEQVEIRQDIIGLLVENAVERQNLRDNILRGIPDICRITRKLVKGKANLQDLVLLYSAIAKIAPIHECLLAMGESTTLNSFILGPLRHLSGQLTKYAELIENTIDFDALKRHEYVIRADFHSDLVAINEQKEKILDQIEREFNRVAQHVGLEKGKKIKLERNPTYGYFFRLSRLDATAIAGEDYQELAALKNGVYFISHSLRELSLKYDEFGKEYAKQQSSLVLEMLEVARTYRRTFDELNDLLARIDVLQSLAYTAVTAPIQYVRPQIVPFGQEMILKGMRHPCLETTSSFIANDVHFAGHSSFQIITGPNMGGKSTYIRSAALTVLLAQIGSFVPCTAAQIPMIDAILVRVGAGDSILKGISTFMAEMLETSSILSTVTVKSLVIIDELGRGTSTSEGFGLAWGVAKRLAFLGCSTFFATHFHELTSLASTVPNVKNLYTEAAIREGLVMTFNVKEGICDQSYGIQCAKMAGFPAVVLDMANILLKDLEGTAFTEDQAKEGLSHLLKGKMALINAPEFVRKAIPSAL